VTTKACIVCGAVFPARGKQKTCSHDCSVANRRTINEAWRCENAAHVVSWRKGNYAKNRDAILRHSSLRKTKPPLQKVCVICAAPFVATGRGRRCAITCSASCVAEMEAARSRALPPDHPRRRAAIVRAKRWKAENPDRSRQLQRTASARAFAVLTDAKVADKLGLPVALARPLIPAKRAQIQITRELRKRKAK